MKKRATDSAIEPSAHAVLNVHQFQDLTATDLDEKIRNVEKSFEILKENITMENIERYVSKVVRVLLYIPRGEKMNDIEQIKRIYRLYWQFMIHKDAMGLQRLMSDDYYLLHMTGVRQTRDEFISGLVGGTFNYYSAQHDDIQVTITEHDADAGEQATATNNEARQEADSNSPRCEATATMVGKSRVVAAVYGGGQKIWNLRGDFTLRKENGVWKLTSSQASTY